MRAQMMGGWWGAPSADMPITPEQAQTLAQQFVNAYLPGVTVEDADIFYGYYQQAPFEKPSIDPASCNSCFKCLEACPLCAIEEKTI